MSTDRPIARDEIREIAEGASAREKCLHECLAAAEDAMRASRHEVFNLRSLVASLQDDLRDYHNVKACYAELSNASATEIGKLNEQILRLEKRLKQTSGPNWVQS